MPRRLSRPELAEKARIESYKPVLATDAGKNMLDDMVSFAQFEKDPIIRCGRADVVLRMMAELRRVDDDEAGGEE